MDFGAKLKQLRQDRRLSQDSLATHLNQKYHTRISKSMISRWENGTDIQMSYVRILTNFFGVDAQEFLEDDNPKGSNILTLFNCLSTSHQQVILDYVQQLLLEQKSLVAHHQQTVQYVKVLGTVSAGTGEYLSDPNPEWEPFNGPVSDYDYAVKVHGDSMMPVFHDGQLILVKRTAQVSSGQIIVVNYDQQAFVKKYIHDQQGTRLESLNPKYASLPINDRHEVSFLGIVVQ